MMNRSTVYALLLCNMASLNGYERITEFISVIHPQSDGCLNIVERITFNVEHRAIRKGIYRSIPTRYSWGVFWDNIDFELKSVLLDGAPAGYKMNEVGSGVVIDIGQQGKAFDALMARGMHTVEISYRLCRIFRFFDDHDELYLNITGLDWSLPIERATVLIHLGDLEPSFRKFIVHTGPLGSRGRNYTSKKTDSLLTITTTHSLSPGSGVTVALAFKKGAIKQPSHLKQLSNFLNDNRVISLAGLLLFYLIFYTLVLILRGRKKRYKHPIIARFSPPKGFSPGQLRYLLKQKIDATCLTADMVYAAVNGLLTITMLGKDSFFSSVKYKLSKVPGKKGTTAQPQSAVLAALMKSLFSRSDSIKLDGGVASRIERAMGSLKLTYQKLKIIHDQYAIKMPFAVVMYIFASLAVVMVWSISRHPQDVWIMVLFIIAAIILAGLYVSYGWIYNTRGRELATHAKGFELYLKTAEVERLKHVGTPPTKTPKLYEKFLPYAIALGVEKEWSDKFVPIFERLAHQGTYQSPAWLIGGNHRLLPRRLAAMSTGMSRSITRVISSTRNSSARRGLFTGGSGTRSGGSGFSRRGSSGGGSGGGGGGGR